MMSDSAMCAKLLAFCRLFSVPVIQVGFCKFGRCAFSSLLEFSEIPLHLQVGGVACIELESGEDGGGGGFFLFYLETLNNFFFFWF